MPLPPPTAFEAQFARRVVSTGAASSTLIALALVALQAPESLPGVTIGCAGSVIGLGLLRNGRHHLGVWTFLVSCAFGVWIAVGLRPTAAEAFGPAGVSWLLLGVFASFLLPRRLFVAYGVLCWVGMVTLSMLVVSVRRSEPDVQGALVCIIFLAAGYYVLGRMAHHFRETIARLELAERESRQAAQAKSRFLANMSHELRTPLNAILGYSEMLLEEAEGDSDDVERIHSAGEMLLGHIDALLDLSKIDAGRMDVYIERFDLAELIHETAAMMAPLVKQQSNRLVLELEPRLDCETDRTKVSQILNNLLTNANKFTQSGVLTVRAHRMAEHMRLEVEDTGIGIEHDVLPLLFDAFTQADSSTTKRYGGTGLGLALVREFAQLLDGSVMVDSTVGEGSTFIVTWRHGAVQES